MPITLPQFLLGAAVVGGGGYLIFRPKTPKKKIYDAPPGPEGAPGPGIPPPPGEVPGPLVPKPTPDVVGFEPPIPPPPPVPTPIPVPPVFRPQPGPWPPTGPEGLAGLPCPTEESRGSVLSTAARFYIPKATEVSLFNFERTGCVYDLVLTLCVHAQLNDSMGEVDYWADLGQPPPEVLQLTDGEGFVDVRRLRIPFAWRRQIRARLHVSSDAIAIANVSDAEFAQKDPGDPCPLIPHKWPTPRGSDSFLVALGTGEVRDWKSEPEVSLVSSGLELGFEVEVAGLPYFFKINDSLRSFDTHTSQFKIAYVAQVAPA